MDNLPATVEAPPSPPVHRKRWRIEGMFGRLESVLHSEIKTLGHPRAALLGFTVAVLAYNVLALLLQAVVEQAHRPAMPSWRSRPSTSPSASGLQGPAGGGAATAVEQAGRALAQASGAAAAGAGHTAACQEARHGQARTKVAAAKGWVDGRTARSHFSTARVLKAAGRRRKDGPFAGCWVSRSLLALYIALPFVAMRIAAVAGDGPP